MSNKTSLGIQLLLLGWLLLANTIKAQPALQRAEAQYNLYNYALAIPLYQQAYKEHASLKAIRGLANSYRSLRQYEEAQLWYERLFALEVDKGVEIPPEERCHYAGVLRSNEQYEKAKKYYKQCADLSKGKGKISQGMLNEWIEACDSAKKQLSAPNPHVLHFSNFERVNTPYSDWGGIRKDGFFFWVSDHPAKSPKRREKCWLRFPRRYQVDETRYSWTGNGYLKPYRLFEKYEGSVPALYNEQFFTGSYHVGMPVFSKDGKEIYFTKTRLIKKSGNLFSPNAPYTINVELYLAKRDPHGNTWETPKPFRYNKALVHSIGDPYLSPDGQRLYFISDKTGGQGGTDIYYCERTSGTTWGEAINLGPMINTRDNERFPFLDTKGNLYFSSEGHRSLGGFDIYEAVVNEEGKLDHVINMGPPINTPQDDFCFLLEEGERSGFLSSNRKGGKGSDDIYFFELAVEKPEPKQQPRPMLQLKGVVVDGTTQQPLQNSAITLVVIDMPHLKPIHLLADSLGVFKTALDTGLVYSMNVELPGYLGLKNRQLSTVNKSVSDTLYDTIRLEKVVLNRPMRLEQLGGSIPINDKGFYGFDEWKLNPTLTAVLDKLVQLMQSNTSIKVVLGFHTDTRGPAAYNMLLSKKRARSATAYLVQQGIAKDRVEAQAYGETRPVNHCVEGVSCTRAEHRQNRRIEYTIVAGDDTSGIDKDTNYPK